MGNDVIRTARRLATPAGIALACTLTACYRPQGALIPYTGGAATYFSHETMPKSVRVIDARTEEVVFSMDIPPGKQLTFEFVDGAGDDPVLTPDAMRYEVFDQGTKIGKLHNQMSVPSASSRRVEIDVTQEPQFARSAQDRELRTDELRDRPDWWTAEGGPLPTGYRGLGNYDD